MDTVVRFITRKGDGAPAAGALRIYTDTTIVEQIPVPASGEASAVLTEGQAYTVSFITPLGYVETFSLTPEASATYAIHITEGDIVALPGKCVVRGRVSGPTGRPTRRFRASVALLSGDIFSDEDFILNDPERLAADDSGVIETELYRNRTYRITLTGTDEYAAFDSFIIYTPDRPFAHLVDLLVPRVISIDIPEITEQGQYPISLLITDGRRVSDYVTAQSFLQISTEGDVVAALVAVDGGAVLDISGDMSTWSVNIYGKTQQFRPRTDTWDALGPGVQQLIARITN